jgi:hypothetical protein
MSLALAFLKAKTAHLTDKRVFKMNYKKIKKRLTTAILLFTFTVLLQSCSDTEQACDNTSTEQSCQPKEAGNLTTDGFSDVVNNIIAGTWDDWAEITRSTPDPITDVANAIIFLAAENNINTTDLGQLLYFLKNYSINGPTEDFTQDEALQLSKALLAVAEMTDFHTTTAPIGLIHENYAAAVANLTNSPASDYFADHLPHLLALIQDYSALSSPYDNVNFDNSANQLLKVIYDTALKAQSNSTLKSAFNDNILSVVSSLRSYGLGESSLDLRWATDKERQWPLAPLFIALGNISKITNETTKVNIDNIIIEIFGKVTSDISIETAKNEITSSYLEAIGRKCEASDALYQYCFVKPTVDDILSITHQCSANIIIRAQSMNNEQLIKSCQKMAIIEDKFHAFFISKNKPVNDDLNAKLEVIIYASTQDYQKYSFEFFNNDASNSGIYLEGEPSVKGNIARLHAIQCSESWAPYSCDSYNDVSNLAHEFVHYLDGRYNQYGLFSYHENTVSWSEGWAEFIAKGAGDQRNLDAVAGKDIMLITDILFTDNKINNLYPWSYLAMQYLAEQRSADVTLLSIALRESDKTLYQAELKTLVESDGDGFINWVRANTDATTPPIPVTPEESQFGSCDLVSQYSREIENNVSINITNNAETPATLYWVNNITGEIDFTNPYQTLEKGGNYISTTVKNDRLAVVDSLNNCLAIAVLTETTNTFTILNSLFEANIPTGTSADLYIGHDGQDLVDQITSNGFDNLSPLFQIKGSNATQVFTNQNILSVLDAIKTRANTYDGINSQEIPELVYFLRAAYYVEFYNDEVASFSEEVKNSLITVLKILFNNEKTWVVSDENGPVLEAGLVLVDSANLGAQFNDVTIRVLTDYNQQWQKNRAMNQAANTVFTTLYRSLWDNDMKALFSTDDSILDALYNFQLNNRDALGTDAEYVLVNSVRELSRLYHIDALIPRVKILVKSVIDSTNKNDETSILWLAAASMADYYDRGDCGYYDICGFSYYLEKDTLSFNYKCSDTLKIRAQHLFNDQAAWICDVLGTQETNFHQTLKTLGIPVADDNNSSLELIIFDSANDYGTYAGQFFNISTNNGGMYLEGAPSVDKNQARFIAYEADWKRPNFHVWNLQHEYVHYLDARFDLYGDFMRGMSVNTVWWTEGLAEYISTRDNNTRAINLGESQTVALSEIFKNTYDSGQDRVYRWGYLAVRFMFEKHSADIDQIVTYTRNDQYTEYQTFIDNIGTTYDVEFNTWLVSNLSTDVSGIVQYGPNDIDSAASGQDGNWQGEPETISTDFSPCIVEIPSQKHNAQNNTITLNSTIECVNSDENKATFVFANTDGLSSQLSITTSGGWGDATILYRANSWASMQNNDGMANSDGNDDSLTITLDSNIYWHYITLDGEFGGVKLQLTTSP